MNEPPNDPAANRNPTATTCPRCGAPTLKSWHDLSAEERDLAHRLSGNALTPTGAPVTPERYCARCLYLEFTPTLYDC